MKTLAGFFLLVVVIAGIAAFCTLRWTGERHPASVNAHAWLHQELHLTAAQHAALEPIEAQFATQQSKLTEELQSANRALARAVGEDKAYTPRVAAAVEMVHHRMGDLQKASLEHVFAMRSVLNPAQGDKLLGLAQQALEANP